MMELKLLHIYPDVLNLYGDRGNILCMMRRLQWRGIGVSVTGLPVGGSADLSDYDLCFIGGGQDFEQQVLLEDLHRGLDREICAAIADGMPFLTICGGYQLLGTSYETRAGTQCDYIGALDFYTVGGAERMIGNYSFLCESQAGGCEIVGFENHSGRTYLGSGVQPLGKILSGFGNNGEDGTEGVHYKNVFGTYSHGPVLPKNPEFCDFLLKTALERKYGQAELMPLEDSVEHAARQEIAVRL